MHHAFMHQTALKRRRFQHFKLTKTLRWELKSVHHRYLLKRPGCREIVTAQLVCFTISIMNLVDKRILILAVKIGCILCLRPFSTSYRRKCPTAAWKIFMSTPQSPKSSYQGAREVLPSAAQILSLLVSPQVAQALTEDITSTKYQRGLLNLPNPLIDDFWYPPFLIGRWNATMKFRGANFTNLIPIETLAQNDNLPGFSKYSVIFAPDMGKEISYTTLRWAQIDSHPREDHPFNMRSLITAFLPDTTVDSAAYSFQKAPNWLQSPANRWTIKYHDSTGEGSVELFTVKRELEVFAGTAESSEFIRQVSRKVIGSYGSIIADASIAV